MIINPYIYGVASTLNTGLFAVYKAESNANDSLGVYNGTAQGGLTYGTGKSGNAFVGNGSNAYVGLPDNMFNTFTGEFSIACWINIVSTGTLQTVISCIRRDSGNYYGFSLYNYGHMWLQINKGTPSGEINLTESTSISYNTWVHIVAVHTSTGNKIYRNGVLTASDSSTQNAVFHPSLANYCSIGAQQNTSYQYFLGNGSKVDELTPYNKALTVSEVTELYNSGAGKFYPFT